MALTPFVNRTTDRCFEVQDLSLSSVTHDLLTSSTMYASSTLFSCHANVILVFPLLRLTTSKAMTSVSDAISKKSSSKHEGCRSDRSDDGRFDFQLSPSVALKSGSHSMNSSSKNEGSLSDRDEDGRFLSYRDEDGRFDVQLRGEAVHYLRRWVEDREAIECAERAKRLALPSPPPSPPSRYVPGNSPLMSRLDPPVWFSKAELLTYVQRDLAEADEMGLTVEETKALFPYMLGRYPSCVGKKQYNGKKRKNDLRDARAEARARRR